MSKIFNINELFKIGTYGEITIDRTELKTIPEYRNVLISDKGSNKDAAGHKKLLSKRIFHFIFLTEDPKSVFYNLDTETKIKYALKDSGMPEELLSDRVVIAAKRRYRNDLELTSTAKAYLASSKGLYSLGLNIEEQQSIMMDIMKILRKGREAVLSKETGEVEKETMLATLLNNLEYAQKVQLAILNTIDRIPKAKDTLDTIASRLAEEGGGKKQIHGKRELGNREEI